MSSLSVKFSKSRALRLCEAFTLMPIRTGIIPVFLVTLSVSAFAEVESNMRASNEDALDLLASENKVYAASRYVQSLEQTPANVSIITKEEIRKFGYRSVTDALFSLPGIYNSSNLAWRTLGIRGFAIPGDFNSRFVYMLNGMPISEPIFGGTLTCQIEIEAIDRIEFIRGPGSAIYGDGAVLGVINIITQAGNAAPGKMVSVTLGNQGAYKISGSTGSGSATGFSHYLQLSYSHSDGVDVYFPEHDRPPISNGNSTGNNELDMLRLFGRITKQDRWLQWHVEIPQRHDPQASYGTTFDSNQLAYNDRTVSLEVGDRYPAGDAATVTVRGFFMRFDERGEYPYSHNPSIYLTEVDSSQSGINLQYERYFGTGHKLISGIETKRVVAKEKEGLEGALNYSGFNEKYWHYGLFSQAEVLVGAGKRLFLGGRYDYLSDYSSENADHLEHLSPRLAYVQEFSPRHVGKLLYGEAFRVATIMEAYYDDMGFSQLENLRIRPEIARTWEAVWEARLHHGTFSLSAYTTRLNDSIVAMDASAEPACISGQCKQYQNIAGTQKLSGVEAAFNIKQLGHWRAYGSATGQRATKPPNDHEAPASPHVLFKLGATHPLPWMRSNGALEIHSVGSMHGMYVNDTSTERTGDVPAYTIMNAALTGYFRQNWRFSFRVDNVFDRQILTVAPLDFAPIERIPVNQRRIALKIARDF